MLEGAYNAATNRMLENNNLRVQGEFNSTSARRMGLNLNTNSPRYQRNLQTDTFVRKKVSEKNIFKTILGIAGVVGAVALGKKVLNMDKVHGFLKKLDLLDTPEKIINRAKEQAAIKKANWQAKNILKKWRKS